LLFIIINVIQYYYIFLVLFKPFKKLIYLILSHWTLLKTSLIYYFLSIKIRTHLLLYHNKIYHYLLLFISIVNSVIYNNKLRLFFFFLLVLLLNIFVILKPKNNQSFFWNIPFTPQIKIIKFILIVSVKSVKKGRH